MEKSSDSDERVMEEVVAGDRERLAILVRRYANPLLTFLTRASGNRHLAEELFQEVFLKVWSKRRQYRSGRPFRPWLFAIAANQWRATARRNRLPVTESEDGYEHLAAVGGSPIEAAISTETAHQVAAAVAQLPDQQRVVVVLRIWNELPYAEIATVANCSENTVRSHMHHGLAAMRRFLERAL